MHASFENTFRNRFWSRRDVPVPGVEREVPNGGHVMVLCLLTTS